MTVERFPARRGELPCGHPIACMFRYRTLSGQILKYCLACVCEQSGIVDIDTQIRDRLNSTEKVIPEAVIVDEPIEEEKPIKPSKNGNKKK